MNSLPRELHAFLRSTFGAIASEEPLSGVAGDGGATRLWFTGGRSIVVKSSSVPRERNFYERYSDAIRGVGVGVPGLYWSNSDDAGRHWIAIEDIANPFPQDRWVCDRGQIQMLSELHAGTWGDKQLASDAATYEPGWDDEMTGRACEWFIDVPEREQIVNQFTALQRESTALFRPLCCVSADPNPTNWRIRENGDLVLIDWERFSHGHPAIDLAITMPGLGSQDGTMERSIAVLYRDRWNALTGRIPAEFDDLEKLIRVAKLWSVVEFLGNARLKPELYPEKTVSYIVRDLPSYLE